MKGKIKKRVLKLTALFVAVLVLYMANSQLLIRTGMSAESHIRNFYREPKNTIDVALIGSSEMYADYSAPLAYDRCGYTSYNLCFDGAVGLYYGSMLKEFMSRQDPQLVVIEVNGYFYTEERSHQEGSVRKWLDNMHKNSNWAGEISKNIPREEQINYYFNLFKYHSNWARPEGQTQRLKDLIRNDSTKVSMMKSFGTRTATKSVAKVKRKGSPKMYDFGEQCLDETISVCKELGIENVLFIRVPHKDKLDDKTSDRIEKIVTDAGYDYVNFERMSDQIGIDEDKDYYNGEHMNVFGNEKNTAFIADYISEHYDLDTSHSEEVDAQWRECADYTKGIFEVLGSRTLENEDLAYGEYSDFSDEARDELLARRERKKKEKAEKEKKGEKFEDELEEEPPPPEG
ncbi:MAG: hypothetical protein J6I46_00365 [Ruminococcus sp.]|nr:hypothetical protein [Ruminococcus sp.]